VKRALLIAASVLAALVLLLYLFGPTIFDRAANRVLEDAPYAASERAQRLFEDLFVVDLHADPLLWDRDLSRRLSHGAIDIPRLIEGNVAVQSFFIVSKSPWTQNVDATPADSDAITTLVAFQGWPRKTWTSLLERALYQSARLHALTADSNGKLVILKSKGDLARFREARRRDRAMVAGVLGIEGAHVLQGELRNLDTLYDAGVRVVAPTHFFDNAIGGSAHGLEKGGLTELGRALLQEVESKGMLFDLAHASRRVFEDTLAMASRPVIVSHTGVRGTCDSNRNLADRELQAVAETGGVIGIGYWAVAVCGEDAASIARAIVYTADLVGVEHVALGSDFDGAVPVPFDTTGLALIVDALLEQGMSEADIRLVMGENAARVFAETLPDAHGSSSNAPTSQPSP
jgi:microsomal dipeptidase-like Zn-dependent dipeptidase